ncbi:MAG: shikimate dehydrogenase, partial [Dehalococcoidaceae bacterium]|nr:shikimate dehydrogenase [Dehalococcoidaceae bacterium]
MKNVQQICALLGNPVEHSLSPVMQNSAFRDKGLNYTYLAFKVSHVQLKTAIEGIRALGFRGLNITIPHKVSVIPLLDELDLQSQRIGAVNTIVNINGKLKGYNTDAAGFMRALEDKGIDPAGKNTVILGAGGAAMAVAYALAEAGADITVLNRLARLNEAVRLTQNLPSRDVRAARALALNPENLAGSLEKAEILVNATSAGMYPKTEDSLVPANLIRPEMIVFDLVYNPLQTRLMSEAASSGARTINGLEMLVWQGALAFELWTGLSAPVGIMRSQALKALGPEPQTPAVKRARSGGASLPDSIALIGFMGSGKTTVAKILAEITGKRLVELDRVIEINAGASIPEIFARKGETGFREIEIESVKEISSGRNQVISCGGGVVLNKINMDRLKESAVICYLEVNPEVIMARMQSQDVAKPVLNNPA